MEAKRYLRLLRVSLLLAPSFLFAQEWVRTKTQKLGQVPATIATDIQGNIFIGFPDGKLTKYNSNGVLLENFSLSNNSSITLVDVQNNLKPFIFYFDNQQITILDRFSSVPKTYLLANFNLDFVMMACPSPDGDFWVLENNPQRLKKLNFNRKNAVLEVQTALGDSIMKMMAYQNLLIIGDEKGIHFYDQFGGFVRLYLIQGLLNFQVRGGILFVYTKKELRKYSLSKSEFLNSVELPDLSPDAILKLEDTYIFLQDKSMIFYRLSQY